jgi:NAD(P)-dependent dehydrogenase (short-subunit alcohol dehydrogenase family)
VTRSKEQSAKKKLLCLTKNNSKITGTSMTKLKDKVVVVTGGARGLGRAICQRLAADGAKIAIADILDSSETIALTGLSEERIFQQKCDITSADDIEKLKNEIDSKFGGCNILVHSAGIFPACPFEDLSFDLWKKVQSVNLDSAFHLCKAFLPGMKEQNWGRVISISSNTFYLAPPALSHYVASKGGLIGLHRVLAAEYGDFGITVNTVAPMLTRTEGAEEYFAENLGMFDAVLEWQDIKRPAEAADIVGAVSFLASDDASFITGQTLPVDGGTAKL